MDNPIEKLDAVLKWLVENSHQFWRIETIVYQESYKPLLVTIDKQLLHILLEKIAKDGYASLDSTQMTVKPMLGEPWKENIWLYKISFEGLLFYKRGGYKAQSKNKAVELRIKQEKAALLSADRKHQAELTEALSNYQRWILIATIVAGLYYLVELLKYFHVLPSKL